MFAGERGAALGKVVEQLCDGSEDVELNLSCGEVADADGSAAAISGEFADFGLGAEDSSGDGVDGVDAIGGG